MEKEPSLVASDDMIKIVLWLSTQHFEELAGRCNRILLFSGIKSVWHPSKIKFLQCHMFAQNAQARRCPNPQVSGEQLAGYKRAFFSHPTKCLGQITSSRPARL
jgi:hypothetical protein